MKTLLFLLFLSLLVACSRVTQDDTREMAYLASESMRCQPRDGRFHFTGPDISLSDMERLGYQPIRQNRPAPTVPWAAGYKHWQIFKSTYRPGDRIRPYELSFKLGERPFEWGYALMRGDCLLFAFATKVA